MGKLYKPNILTWRFKIFEQNFSNIYHILKVRLTQNLTAQVKFKISTVIWTTFYTKHIDHNEVQCVCTSCSLSIPSHSCRIKKNLQDTEWNILILYNTKYILNMEYLTHEKKNNICQLKENFLCNFWTSQHLRQIIIHWYYCSQINIFLKLKVIT